MESKEIELEELLLEMKKSCGGAGVVWNTKQYKERRTDSEKVRDMVSNIDHIIKQERNEQTSPKSNFLAFSQDMKQEYQKTSTCHISTPMRTKALVAKPKAPSPPPSTPRSSHH
ncbi:hypothetical protein Celaphus_00011731 [Cervus elaphus hippelaphus]|uniref:Uncharacterized protein n=1 Tax=Cervus elaphus hippelaphus TaxID=46360 RepID=A0A212DFD5_CEREH|nr:hypothetical protein Celaphus_00011731 [Cervus elaphus hippelaphus]